MPLPERFIAHAWYNKEQLYALLHFSRDKKENICLCFYKFLSIFVFSTRVLYFFKECSVTCPPRQVATDVYGCGRRMGVPTILQTIVRHYDNLSTESFPNDNLPTDNWSPRQFFKTTISQNDNFPARQFTNWQLSNDNLSTKTTIYQHDNLPTRQLTNTTFYQSIVHQTKTYQQDNLPTDSLSSGNLSTQFVKFWQKLNWYKL